MAKKPAIYNIDTVGKLFDLSNKLSKSRTLEGQLANIIIKHQIAENLLKHLIIRSDLALNLALRPESIRARKLSDFDGLMFGQLIKEIEFGVRFKGHSELIKSVGKINAIRVLAVHKLFGQDSNDMIKKGKEINIEFEIFYQLYEEAFSWFGSLP